MKSLFLLEYCQYTPSISFANGFSSRQSSIDSQPVVQSIFIDNINSSSSSIPKIDSNNVTMSSASEELSIKKKKLSAFIMLLSLSIHGLFECLALGIQTNYKNAMLNQLGIHRDCSDSPAWSNILCCS